MSGQEALEASAVVVDKLFLLMRVVGVYGRDHPRSNEICAELQAAVAAAEPPFSLRLADGLFRDSAPVPLEVARFQRFRAVAEALSELGVEALDFAEELEQSAVLELGASLARAEGGELSELPEEPVPPASAATSASHEPAAEAETPRGDRSTESSGIILRPTLAAPPDESPRLRLHQAAESIAGLLDPGAPWPLRDGVAAIGALELAVADDARRAVGLGDLYAPASAPPGRVLRAALELLALLELLGVHRGATRALVHALLVVGSIGLREPGGLDPQKAAERGLERLHRALAAGSEEWLAAHSLRLASLLRALAATPPSELPALVPLRLSYHGEQLRVQRDRVLDRAEVLARLLAGGRFPKLWLRALHDLYGPAPAGALVALAGGRLARVADAGEGGPEIFIDGERRPLPGVARPVASSEL